MTSLFVLIDDVTTEKQKMKTFEDCKYEWKNNDSYDVIKLLTSLLKF